MSALTLGGGGIGQVWGTTSRAEAVATVRAALDAGITMLDVAPTYGDGEAERVVGEALGGRLPEGVLISTKCRVGAPAAGEVGALLEESLRASLERLRLERVDVFFVHNQIVERDGDGPGTPRALFAEAVRPALERMVADGRVGAWGLTGVGEPSAILETVAEEPAPGAIQCIANLLDSAGAIQRFAGPLRAREIIEAAAGRGVGVMASARCRRGR